MTAFNAVRFKVRPGREAAFLDAHRTIAADWPGLRRAHIIETGGGGYCLIAEWPDMAALARARDAMIATLDSFRDTLEEIEPGRGVTDPVAGEVVFEAAERSG
jgi:quinol monooxygenase YgiN